MTGHPQDEAFLDTLVFNFTLIRRCCDRCARQAPTVVVGSIEQSSGPGYDIRHCRNCVAICLSRARALAVRAGRTYEPAIPGVETI